MKYSILILFAAFFFSACEKPVELNDREKILLLILEQNIENFNTTVAPVISTGTKYDLIEVLADDTLQLYVRPQWLRSSENNALRDAKLPASLSAYEELLASIKDYSEEGTIDLENIKKRLKDRPKITNSADHPEQLMGKVFISYVAIDEENNRAMAYVMHSKNRLDADGGSGFQFFDRNGADEWVLKESLEVEAF